MTKAVLFDLDGTLLPMDQDEFTKYYFGLLAKRICAEKGYDPQKFVNSIWTGLKAMVKNDGSKTNEEAWWQAYCEIFGPRAREDEPLFRRFYENEFNQAARACGKREEAARITAMVKEKGLRLILATNPVFPAVATENRIRWAGMQPQDFELYTTYENFTFSKPNPEYYLQIMEKTGLSPSECVMVGNDVDEDMIAAQLGMKVFLLTDCIINKSGTDISALPQGGFDRLADFIRSL